MNRASTRFQPFHVLLGIALLVALTGCVGYVGDGYGGATVIAPAPEVTFYGGGYYERGHDVRVYSHRGFESRGGGHRR